eukprot:m.342349 g.342349  ORF g.342349 m.342349 type:complete len:323 (-) comp21298_c0_seq1:34-1002(-)
MDWFSKPGKLTAEEGDTVILNEGGNKFCFVVLKKDAFHQNKFGTYFHNNMIGKPYGSKVHSKSKTGWVHILRPTPELWTICLSHRTQILYSTDISTVVTQLDLKPGSVVVESGTGSGSLSHALIRTIRPSGHLHTFEFHEVRAKKAMEEFESHGLKDYVTVKHADACNDGFGLENVADAVFLDLPKPWDAIESAVKALKRSGGRLCSFSPCIEQVQQTCDKLTELGFKEIKTYSALERSYNVKSLSLGETNITEPPTTYLHEALTNRKRKRDGDDADKRQQKKEKKVMAEGIERLVSYPANRMPGHTGYLTFATLRMRSGAG